MSYQMANKLIAAWFPSCSTRRNDEERTERYARSL
jgi:hypothetical protein